MSGKLDLRRSEQFQRAGHSMTLIPAGAMSRLTITLGKTIFKSFACTGRASRFLEDKREYVDEACMPIIAGTFGVDQRLASKSHCRSSRPPSRTFEDARKLIPPLTSSVVNHEILQAGHRRTNGLSTAN